MDISKIKQMVADGFATRKIAALQNEKVEELEQLIRENNLCMEKLDFNFDEIPKIKSLYENGVSAKQLGIKYGIDKRRVQKWAREEGTYRDKNLSHRIFHFNENIFDLIDSPEKAYWLGFLYADLYNYNDKRHYIRLELKLTDKDHVINFCNFVGYDPSKVEEVEILSKESGKIYYSARVTINSIHLTNQLTKLGCGQNKSLTISYPNWLKDELHVSFIRGIFDGDGSIKHTKSKNNREYNWSITGTREICEGIKKVFIEKYGIPLTLWQSAEDKTVNTWTVESSGNLKIHKICEIVYKNATICLPRKYQRYQELIEYNLSKHPKLFAAHHFNDIFIINGKELSKNYINSLLENEKRDLIPLIILECQKRGFLYPDSLQAVNTEYTRLLNTKVNTEENVLNNNGRLGTIICKYFCSSFYNTKARDYLSVRDAFLDSSKLESAISVQLGLKKEGQLGVISINHIIAALKDARLCAQPSIFKPSIAKFICSKYSEEGDVVGDYSCGFGGRLLGAMSCGRKYVGTDPLTVPELQQMVDHFGWHDRCKLIYMGSEFFRGGENSVDLYWSSPPYFDQEIYSDQLTQAYSKGEQYFYYQYWSETLKNVQFMLKPNKWFGLNVSDKYYKMVELAKEFFGPVVETVDLKSHRDHFGNNKDKVEHIYMFKNNK